MLQRVRLLYNDENKTIKSYKLPIKNWVKAKVNEPISTLVYVDDFSAIYLRNPKEKIFVVYAHTHRDAQKALQKHFIKPLTSREL